MKITRFSFFEGFLCGMLALDVFLALNYGLEFTLIKNGNYLGPSAIYGVPILFSMYYVLIVFFIYEFLTERNAVQSITYTLLGYFYLDSIVQIYYTTMYNPNESWSTLFRYIFFNPDYLCLFFIIYVLMLFHLGIINNILKYAKISINYEFYFDLKKLIFFFIILAPLWYFTLMLKFTPVSLFLPLFIYVLSKKRGSSRALVF